MPLDGIQSQEKSLTDLVVGESLGNELQHFELSLAQRLDQRLGGRRRGSVFYRLLFGFKGSQEFVRITLA